MPARPISAVSGSCRVSTASADSSRSETKIARGATRTAAARSHQFRSTAVGVAVSTLIASEGSGAR